MTVTLKRRHLYLEVDRWGNTRVYFRAGRGPRTRIRDPLGSEQFDQRYHELLRQHAAGELRKPPSDAPKTGTFKWLCIEYFKSVTFKQLDLRTQRVTTLIVEKMWLEPRAKGAQELFADCPLTRFDGKAVRILRDRRADKPEAANNRLRRLRAIFAWALENDYVSANPARDASFKRKTNPHGFPTWTAEQISRYEEYHPVGSKARLALALLYNTGVRRSDVVQLGAQNLLPPDADAPFGRILFRPFKGRKRSARMLNIPILPDLDVILRASNVGELAFLVTSRGRPFSAAGFTNWFRERCEEAGLNGVSAHGLRKAAATRIAEAGGSNYHLMGYLGWQTSSQADVYTKAADSKRLAEEAGRLLGTKQVEKSLTSDTQLGQVREIARKKLG